MTADRVVEVHADADGVAEAASPRVAEAARRAVAARSRFAIALAGGSTPGPTYTRLAEESRRGDVPWETTEVFWGDERCVPADHPDSNARMARKALLDRVPVPDERIHPIRAWEPDPEVAADLYEREIRRVLAPVGERIPRLDLVLLGLGPDGHTASLFPGTAALEEEDRLVAVVRASEPGLRPPRVERITLTPAAINAARTIVFLVTGGEKAGAVAAVLAERGEDATWPARRIHPADGEVVWLLDEAAAAEIR